MEHPMRTELTCEGLQVLFANRYIIRGAQADCILCIETRLTAKKEGPGDVPKLHLIVKLQLWGSLPLLPSPLWLGVVVPVGFHQRAK